MTGLLVIRASIVRGEHHPHGEQRVVRGDTLPLLKRAASEKIAEFEREVDSYMHFSAVLIPSHPEIPVGLWHPAAREFRSRL